MKYAIILSGGVGNRMELAMPKQYYEVNQKPLLCYTLSSLMEYDALTGFVVVASPEWHSYILHHMGQNDKFMGFAQPGENRQMSIYNGLKYLESLSVSKEALVMIQDAARPNTSLALIERCFGIMGDEDGAMPVLPMKDTVYLSENGEKVTALLNRKEVFAGQAPEVFRFGEYLAANEALLPKEILFVNGSTEPAVLAGLRIKMIPGEESNFKITTQTDLERFEQIVHERY